MKSPKFIQRVMILLALLLVDAGSPSAQSMPASPATEAQTVDYCELIRKAAFYDKKLIRVRALYVVGFEAAYLYGPACREKAGGDDRVWVEFDESFERSSEPEVAKKFQRLLKSSRTNEYKLSRVEVVFIGRFDGVKQAGEMKLANGQVFKFSTGYGHMNAYDYQLTATSIEEAKAVPKGVKW